MSSLTLKNLCIALLALVTALSIGVCARVVVDAGRETRQTIAEVRPELVQTLKQAKITAFEVQAASKALKQEATDPQSIQDRQRLAKSANVVLAGTAQTLDRINGETIPALNDTITELRAQVRSTGDNLNTVFLPELGRATKSLADIAEKFAVDQQQLTVQVAGLIEAGKLSVEGLTKLLNGPELQQILANVNTTTRSFDATSANIAEASKRLPTIADQVEKILKTSNQFQKPLLVAQLLATIARIFY